MQSAWDVGDVVGPCRVLCSYDEDDGLLFGIRFERVSEPNTPHTKHTRCKMQRGRQRARTVTLTPSTHARAQFAQSARLMPPPERIKRKRATAVRPHTRDCTDTECRLFRTDSMYSFVSLVRACQRLTVPELLLAALVHPFQSSHNHNIRSQNMSDL